MAKPPRPPGKPQAKLGSIQDVMKKLQNELADASAGTRNAGQRVGKDLEEARELAARVRRDAAAIPSVARADAERAQQRLKNELRSRQQQRERAAEPDAAPARGGLQGALATILAQVAAASAPPRQEAPPPPEPEAPPPPEARIALPPDEPAEPAPQAAGVAGTVRRMLADPTSLRAAFILQEILAPPKSLRR